MPFFIVLTGIIVLLLLIIRFKVHAFIALVLVALGIGIAQGLSPAETAASIQKGVGSTLGYLALILGFGAIFGAVLVDSGAAQSISDRLIARFGRRYISWAMVLTGFIIGIPLFYTVGFVMLIPLVFTVARQLGLPLVYVGIPMVSALSVTHGFLPPHPAPTTISLIYEADMGLTLLYGLLIALPAIVIAGPLFARTLRKLYSEPPAGLIPERTQREGGLPSFGLSLLIALTPVLLMGLASVVKLWVAEETGLYELANFLGDPVIALLAALLLALWLLGIGRGATLEELQRLSQESVKGIAMILLVIGGGGALKQVLIDSGISDHIVHYFSDKNMPPIVLAWLIAAALRIALGSATVAAITAAGIVAPLIQSTDVSPELLVLATGAGSLTCSQVNDTGFWLFKEYFNLSIKQTFLTWTVMETIISVCGLLGCLGLDNLVK